MDFTWTNRPPPPGLVENNDLIYTPVHHSDPIQEMLCKAVAGLCLDADQKTPCTIGADSTLADGSSRLKRKASINGQEGSRKRLRLPQGSLTLADDIAPVPTTAVNPKTPVPISDAIPAAFSAASREVPTASQKVIVLPSDSTQCTPVASSDANQMMLCTKFTVLSLADGSPRLKRKACIKYQESETTFSSPGRTSLCYSCSYTGRPGGRR